MDDLQRAIASLIDRLVAEGYDLPAESYVKRSNGRVLRVTVEEIASAEVATVPGPSAGLLRDGRTEAAGLLLRESTSEGSVVNVWRDTPARKPGDPVSHIVNNVPGHECVCCNGSGKQREERPVFDVPVAYGAPEKH